MMLAELAAGACLALALVLAAVAIVLTNPPEDE